MNTKVRTIFIVAGIFLVGYAAMRLLKTGDGGDGSARVSNSQFMSLERRRIPCGRILERSVQEKDGTWTKTVRILDPSGTKELKSKTTSVEDDACDKIRVGVFVPGLWGQHGTLGCYKN